MNRGGLWVISNETENRLFYLKNIFLFKLQIQNLLNIDINMIINLLSYCYIQEYQNILSSDQLEANETIADSIVYSIVALHTR